MEKSFSINSPPPFLPSPKSYENRTQINTFVIIPNQ